MIRSPRFGVGQWKGSHLNEILWLVLASDQGRGTGRGCRQFERQIMAFVLSRLSIH